MTIIFHSSFLSVSLSFYFESLAEEIDSDAVKSVSMALDRRAAVGEKRAGEITDGAANAIKSRREF